MNPKSLFLSRKLYLNCITKGAFNWSQLESMTCWKNIQAKTQFAELCFFFLFVWKCHTNPWDTYSLSVEAQSRQQSRWVKADLCVMFCLNTSAESEPAAADTGSWRSGCSFARTEKPAVRSSLITVLIHPRPFTTIPFKPAENRWLRALHIELCLPKRDL